MITIIDYGMGNLRSVQKALETLGAEVNISSKKEDLKNADKLILPGVGAFPDAMNNLRERGLFDVIREEVIDNKKIILGICLGVQLLAEKGYELKECEGLGLIPGEVIKFDVEKYKLKIPHVGWNNLINIKKDCPLFKNFEENELSFYFVHSYHFKTRLEEHIAAECNYGINFTAVVHKDNVYGTQFHPEKSQRAGLKLLENFINI